jgi:hypothetical protein
MRDKGLRVRARDGALGALQSISARNALRRALVSPLRSGSLNLRLASSFVGQEAAGSYVDLLLHLDSEGVHFARDTGGCWTAPLELAVALWPLDPGLAPSDRVATHSLEARGCGERAGFVIALRERVPLPGGYQVRVAIRNSGEQAAGSASEVLWIPDLKRSPLALSGVTLWTGDAPSKPPPDPVIRPAADSDPAVRRFSAGGVVKYASQVFGNAAAVRAQVLRDGREVSSSPGAAGSLSGLPPGQYMLHVSATRGRDRADQFRAFEIR